MKLGASFHVFHLVNGVCDNDKFKAGIIDAVDSGTREYSVCANGINAGGPGFQKPRGSVKYSNT